MHHRRRGALLGTPEAGRIIDNLDDRQPPDGDEPDEETCWLPGCDRVIEEPYRLRLTDRFGGTMWRVACSRHHRDQIREEHENASQP